MLKNLVILRNNWKKVSFATVALAYGAHLTKEYIDISIHMRNVCKEVLESQNNSKEFGTKRVLVILNPVANKKKAENTFKKYCEPILHIAGYSVEILKTNYVGHAKSVLESLQVLPDVIVVAGGDGTSSEVVTGLLRRKDTPCPILFLPLGIKNETARHYLNIKPENHLEYVKSVSTALLPLLKENLEFKNVIQYDVIENDSEEAVKNLKPIYGLTRFSWGLLRDIDSIKDNYWYFGYLRHHAAVLLKSFSKDLNWNFSTNFVYTPPCNGCTNCIVRKQQSIPTSSYLRKLLPSVTKREVESITPTLNENCNTIIQGCIETSQLNISCHQKTNTLSALETKFIDTLTPGLDFIKKISSITNNNIEPTLVLNSRTIQLIPNLINDANKFYSIDGEEYDVRPIKISLIPNAIKVFC